MADNTTLPGTGEAIADEDIAGVKYQRIKLVDATAAATAATGVTANPLKVAGPDCVSLRSVTLNAAGADTAIDTTGYGSVVYELSGQWSGVVKFETNNDNGTAWFPVLVCPADLPIQTDVASVPGMYIVKPTGKYLRINPSVLNGSMVVLALGRSTTAANPSDVLALAMDQQNQMPLNVALNGVRQDGRGALVLSDAPLTSYASATVASATLPLLTIDTTGYGCVVMTQLSGAGTMSGYFSDDGKTWSLQPCLQQNTGTNWAMSASGLIPQAAIVPGSLAAQSAVWPVTGRYFRVLATAVTTAPFAVSVTPRVQQFLGWNWGIGSNSFMGVDIKTIGATTLAAEDAAASTIPMLIGGVVRAATIAPNTLVQGDVARATFTTSGTLVVEKHQVPEMTWQYAGAASGIVSSTTAVAMKAAVAGQRGCVSALQISTDTLSGATEVTIADGAAVILWRGKLQTGPLAQQSIVFDPPLRASVVNSAINFTVLTSVTGGVYVNAQGFMANI